MQQTQPTAQDVKELIFAQFAQNFGIPHENIMRQFSRITETLEALVENRFPTEDVQHSRFGRESEALLTRIIEQGTLSPRECRLLWSWRSDYLDLLKQKLDRSLSEMEIGCFCLIAESGRQAFESKSFASDEFVSTPVLTLAKQIRDNPDAYTETLAGPAV